jgi:hypothetical protein
MWPLLPVQEWRPVADVATLAASAAMLTSRPCGQSHTRQRYKHPPDPELPARRPAQRAVTVLPSAAVARRSGGRGREPGRAQHRAGTTGNGLGGMADLAGGDALDSGEPSPLCSSSRPIRFTSRASAAQVSGRTWMLLREAPSKAMVTEVRPRERSTLAVSGARLRQRSSLTTRPHSGIMRKSLVRRP